MEKKTSNLHKRDVSTKIYHYGARRYHEITCPSNERKFSWIMKAFHPVSSWSTSPQNGLQLNRNRMNVSWSRRNSKVDDRDVRRLDVIQSTIEDISISNEIILIVFQSVILDQIKIYSISFRVQEFSIFS